MGAFSLIVVKNLLNRCDNMDPLKANRPRQQPKGFPYKWAIFYGGCFAASFYFFRLSYDHQYRKQLFQTNSKTLKYFYRLHDSVPIFPPLLEVDLVKFKATQAQKDFYN